jgi:hypothetical protein
MELSGDELAGVVDLFGGLTRAELDRAVEELAFKRGVDHEPDALDDAVADARASYHLVAVENADGKADAASEKAGRGDDPLLVAGPVAFPTLPEGATDLPHILAVPERDVDRETAGEAAREQLQVDALAAAREGDSDRADALLDVCYDLEAWAPVDTDEFRERLDDV